MRSTTPIALLLLLSVVALIIGLRSCQQLDQLAMALETESQTRLGSTLAIGPDVGWTENAPMDATTTAAQLDLPSHTSNVVSLQRRFVAARSVTEAQRIVTLAYAADLPEAVDWENEVDRCRQLANSSRWESHPSPTVQALGAYNRRFCEGYVPTVSAARISIHGEEGADAEWRELWLATQLGKSSELVQRTLTATESPTEAAATLMRMLANAGSWVELDGLIFGYTTQAEYDLLSTFQSLWSLYVEASHPTLPSHAPLAWNHVQIMEAVVDLYGCGVFGGCNAFSRRALEKCVAYGCPFPISIEDYWRSQMLSPAQFEVAWTISQELLRTRRSP